jgi:predicted nuclease of restriction endonuclease-like (RecB) superfamily
MQNAFPGSKGFSLRNLQYMQQFYETYPLITQQAVAQLPWGHIIVLIERVKDIQARDWYAQNALKNGISRNILMMQIKQNLYTRQGKNDHKVTNFERKLPGQVRQPCHYFLSQALNGVIHWQPMS